MICKSLYLHNVTTSLVLGRLTSGLKGRSMLPSRRRGFDVEEDVHGATYEGDFVSGLKHGKGRYTWRSGEFYEGSFYKDYRHGDGVYSWPSGHTFTGKFYLNWREGYGQQLFPDGATFKGLYHADQRFGPGVLSEPSGRQDVGFWYGKHLIQLCHSVQDSFSLKKMTGYADYLAQTSASCYQSQPNKDALLYDGDTILPSGIEYYSTDGDNLPFPPEKRREFDQHFYGQLWEPSDDPCQGYTRDPLPSLPMKTRMMAHIHRHRRLAGNLDWDIAAVLSLKRDSFGPNGPLEVTSELLIQQAAKGERQSVLKLLLDGLVHPDVADSQGHTALIGATVNCHNEVIDLLLDMGADIDKLNDEGVSALSVCHVLYYPFESLHTFAGLPAKAQGLMPLCKKKPQIGPLDLSTDSPGSNNRPWTCDTIQLNQNHLSDQTTDDVSGGVRFHPSGFSELSTDGGTGQGRNRKAVCNVANYTELEVKTRSEDAELGEGGNMILTNLNGAEELEEDEENQEKKALLSKRSIQVLDGHVLLGSVEWQEYLSVKQNTDKNLTGPQSFASSCSMNSYNIEVTEEVLQGAAEALSHTGCSQHSDTPETVRRMAAMKHRARLSTLNLLLDRGADPNTSSVPLPVLFVAIMAGDTQTVKKLLLCTARTDVSLPPERKGLYPLHVAAALPGPEGPKITELLLHALSDPDARAGDHDEMYQPDKVSRMAKLPLRTSEKPRLLEGGRTALHMACQRDTDHCNASKVVFLLVSHRARTDLLWSGHSPLSLAISSGNDMAVEELLKGGADPNLPLGCGVGSALCALSNFNYCLDGKRAKLLDMLEKAGADMLMPVQVGDTIGNVVDYAHDSFSQDVRIADTPFHALNVEERETFQARCKLLSRMGDLLRQAAVQKERGIFSNDAESNNQSPLSTAVNQRTPLLKFCYHCGRSVAVKLTACTRCHEVVYCSTTCKVKAWDKRHKEECLPESGGNHGSFPN
ncbi:ankyrin repeat and MYND domain-containing protein 1-like isoform X2 [Entelurus aequoreus]|uniref:ankyrin repeat and MYND domain-containing protein 1-like isoform X2 n=1 Tax=Entelurus aequoreus TaxID=161455 RepID=UPI002B1D2CBE|nr:ankyrin repeat and MYND domain-containing protein 1-like isoform X2 [Entelurus aequoreus]